MRRIPVLSLAVLAVVAAGCGGAVAPVVQGAYVRAVVASPGYSNVDAYLNNLSLGRNLGNLDAAPRAEASFYNPGSGGARTLSIRPNGSSTPIVSVNLPLAELTFTTAIALGTPGGTGATAPRFLVVTDPKSAIPDDLCTLRFVNVSTYSGDVDIYVDPAGDPSPITGKTPDFTNIGSEDVTATIGLVPANWRFVITRAGTKQTLYDFSDTTINRTYGIMLLSDDATGTGFRLTPYGGSF